MKKIIRYFFAVSLVLTACSQVEELEHPELDRPEIGPGESLVMVTSPILGGGVSGTRATYDWRTEGSGNTSVHTVTVNFENGDKLAVFPQTNENQLTDRNIYNLTSQNGSTAYFRGDNFDLKKGKKYYCLYPCPQNIADIEDLKNIELSYKGQCQTENGSTAHLGKYDYQAGYAEAKEDNVVNFRLRRLGAVARIRVYFGYISSAPMTFTKFEFVTADNYDFQYKRYLDLTDSECDDPADYEPRLTFKTPSTDSDPHSYTLELGEPDPALGTKGITIKPREAYLTMYMMLPASAEYSTKSLYGKITQRTSEGDKMYYVKLQGFDIEPNDCLNWGQSAAASGTLNVTVNINKDWQVGNTVTRGVGDPGYDGETLTKPTNIDIYTLTSRGSNPLTYKKLESLTTIDPSKWRDNGNLWTYSEAINIDIEDADKAKIYAVASNQAIAITSSLTAGTSTEEDVKGLQCTVTNSEDLLMNTYSYAYEATASMPVINATLYHVGAKLDVQWNSASKLTGNVIINNLPNNNLYIFKPTEQATSGSWSPTHSFDESNCYNGRTVFYVPQLASQKYNIQVGAASDPVTKDDVTFNAPTGGGYTSWFKANIKK